MKPAVYNVEVVLRCAPDQPVQAKAQGFEIDREARVLMVEVDDHKAVWYPFESLVGFHVHTEIPQEGEADTDADGE